MKCTSGNAQHHELHDIVHITSSDGTYHYSFLWDMRHSHLLRLPFFRSYL